MSERNDLFSGDDSADQSDVDNNEKSHAKISRSSSNQSETRYRTKSENQNLSEPVIVKRKSSHSPRNSFDRPVLPPPPPPKLNPQKEWFVQVRPPRADISCTVLSSAPFISGYVL